MFAECTRCCPSGISVWLDGWCRLSSITTLPSISLSLVHVVASAVLFRLLSLIQCVLHNPRPVSSSSCLVSSRLVLLYCRQVFALLYERQSIGIIGILLQD
jgi:hypothetical protein